MRWAGRNDFEVAEDERDDEQRAKRDPLDRLVDAVISRDFARHRAVYFCSAWRWVPGASEVKRSLSNPPHGIADLNGDQTANRLRKITFRTLGSVQGARSSS